ncbi:MAG TPA: hypothetical protein VIJ42_09315 [Stellaceae bacterium]
MVAELFDYLAVAPPAVINTNRPDDDDDIGDRAPYRSPLGAGLRGSI